MKRISYLGLCRGYGKAHLAFSVAADDCLSVRAFTKDGVEVPAELRLLATGDFCSAGARIAAVSVPMLSASVMVELSAQDANGESSEHFCVRCDPRLSIVQSKLFSRSHAQVAELLRNLDDKQVPGESFARLTGVYPRGDVNVWRFSCRFPQCAAQDRIDIQVADGGMRAVPCLSLIHI